MSRLRYTAEQEEDTFREAEEGATPITFKIHAEKEVVLYLIEAEGALPIQAWITKNIQTTGQSLR